MRKKTIFGCLIFLTLISPVIAQTKPVAPGSLKPEWQKLLLELSSNYFTVVKENQVDLDSSLIFTSSQLRISRLPIASEGIPDDGLLSRAGWFDRRNSQDGERQLASLKGKDRAEQLILLGAYFAFEPATRQNANQFGIKYLLEGIQLSRSLKHELLALAGQRLLAKIYLKQYDLKRADSIFQYVNNSYGRINDLSAQARTLQWWALYMPVAATTTSGRLINIQKAIILFDKTGNREEKINALINRSYLLLLTYNAAAALKAGQDAEKTALIIGFPYQHYITAALATITMFQNKFGEPLEYAVETVQRAEILRDSIGLPYFYGNVGALYINIDDDGALTLQWSRKALDCFLRRHEVSYLLMNNIVNLMLAQGHVPETYALIKRVYQNAPPKLSTDSMFYYLALGKYYADINVNNGKLALKYLNEAAAIEQVTERNGLSIRKGAILSAFGAMYFNQHEYKKARQYFQQCTERTSLGGETISSKTAVWAMLIQIDSLAGDERRRSNDYSHYADYLRQYFAISKSKLAEELQVKYATDQKESQIKLLNQKAALEQANLKQANLVKDITVGGILLLLIIAGLLYRQMRLKQKNNDIVTQKNQLLQRLVEEKEWLVKEIHHRVKNNLHTVICLLESQAAYLDNDALKAIENSQHRIYAMSLIHQKLYQSNDIKVIDMHDYLTEFIQYLTDSFGSPENIKLDLNVEPIKLGAAQAIPVGLIINEAVNNCFKYAFPDQQKGKIHISFNQVGDNIMLSVSDNGVGLKKNIQQELSSLGLELIKGLTKDLHGKVVFEVKEGTVITLNFPIDKIAGPAKGINKLKLIPLHEK